MQTIILPQKVAKKSESSSSRETFGFSLFMRVAGLEPARDFSREILSLLCLPIPPYPHSGTYRARTCDPLLVRQMLSQLS